MLGHKSRRIRHYSPPELSNLIPAAEKVWEAEPRKIPATTCKLIEAALLGLTATMSGRSDEGVAVAEES